MRARTLLALWLAPLALAALAGTAGASETVQASSELTPRVVGVGERVRFTIAVEGPGFLMPRLRPHFDPGDLELVAGPDVNHGLTLTGGGGWRYSWTWWLEAKQTGAAVVTDVYVRVDDRTVDLPARRVEVVSQPVGGSDPPRTRLEAIEELLDRTRERLSGEPPDEPPDAFLRAVASPPHPFVGQRVVYTVYLYNRTPVRSCVADELPAFQGLWARPIDLPGARQELVDWEGETYQRTAILSKELFALSARPRRIEPLRARLVIEKPDRDRSIFFHTWSPRALSVESNAIDLDVRPLPPGGSGGGGAFAGAVGWVAVAVDLRPSEVTVGESATLTVTIAGEGHLESMPAPRIVAGEGIEVLGPQSVSANGLELSGEAGNGRRWQYVLVPRRAGAWELPPVEVPYFDPEDEAYRVARARVPELRVLGDASDDPGEAIARVLPDAPAPPTWARRWATHWRSAPVWVAVPLAVVAAAPLLAILLFVRRRSGVLAGGGRSTGRARGRTSGLPRAPLDAALREERPRRAAAALEGAWREMLGDVYGVPGAVPPARWADEALARGADRGACRTLRELVDDLHYLRFAPELSETRSLTAELVERSESLARRFDAERGP